MINGRFPTQTKPQSESQALLAVVSCGLGRGVAGLKLSSAGHASSEHFIPFTASQDATASEYAYAGLIAALDRLRTLSVERVLVTVDDQQLADELERRTEPPRDLTLAYIIAGCKLNEFRRAKVVAGHSGRLAQLRAKTENLAATVYSATLPLATAI